MAETVGNAHDHPSGQPRGVYCCLHHHPLPPIVQLRPGEEDVGVLSLDAQPEGAVCIEDKWARIVRLIRVEERDVRYHGIAGGDLDHHISELHPPRDDAGRVVGRGEAEVNGERSACGTRDPNVNTDQFGTDDGVDGDVEPRETVRGLPGVPEVVPARGVPLAGLDPPGERDPVIEDDVGYVVGVQGQLALQDEIASDGATGLVELGVVQGVVGGLAVFDLLVQVRLHAPHLQDAIGIVLEDRSPPGDGLAVRVGAGSYDEGGDGMERTVEDLNRKLQMVTAELDMLERTPTTEARLLEELQVLDRIWDELFPAERERLIRLVVDGLTVNPDGLVLVLRADGLGSLIAEFGSNGAAQKFGATRGRRPKRGQPQADVDADAGRITLRLPMKFKRKAGRKQVILPGEAGIDSEHSPVQGALAIAMARAHRWLQLLEDGRFSSLSELAEAVDMDPSLLRRHLNLTLLSPAMVRRVLDGTEPEGWSVNGLVQVVQAVWVEEHEPR